MLNFIKEVFGLQRPTILYKYISEDKFKYYFPSLTIAFPKLELLNDPMEGSIENMLTHIKETISLESIQNYMDRSYVWAERTLPGAFTYSKMSKRADENNLLKAKYDLLKHCKEHIGILSLTSDPLNPLMWSHYANTYKGICIGFDLEKLLNLKINANWQYDNCKRLFRLLKVRYKKRPPTGITLSLENYVLSAFRTKFINWSYEKEYRLIRPILDNDKNILIMENPTDIISEVYIGHKSIFRDQFGILPHDVKIFTVSNNLDNYGLSAKEIYRS